MISIAASPALPHNSYALLFSFGITSMPRRLLAASRLAVTFLLLRDSRTTF